MGGKTTPTQLKILKGNPGKRPHSKNEPKPDPSIPKPPSHLCRVAKTEWNKISSELYIIGLLTKVDKAVLAAYCTSYALWARAWHSINRVAKKRGKDGLTITTTNGNIIQNPAVGTANKAAIDMVKYAAELGMTPSARTKIQINGPKKENSEDKYFA